MRYSAFLGSALAAIAALSLPVISISPASADRSILMPSMPVISKPRKKARASTRHPRNGKREVARRLRQIAAGQLTRSNGLATGAERNRLLASIHA